MVLLKWLLMSAGFAMFGTAAGLVGYDVYLAMQFQKLMRMGEAEAARPEESRRDMTGSLTAADAGRSLTATSVR